MYLIFCALFLILFRIFYLKSKKIKDYFEFGPVGDSSIYLQMIQHYRKSGDKIHDDRLLLTQNLHFHPNLYERLIGKFFDDEFIDRYSWVPNLLIYCVSVVIFLIFLSNHNIGDFNLILISILFLTQAENFGFDFNRIHYLSLQPRYLGVVICSFFWMLFCFTAEHLSNLDIALLVLIPFIGWNISKFSQQSLFFSSLIFSLLTLNFTTFISVIIGFGLNFIINWHRNYYMLKEQIKFYKWKLSERHPTTKNRGKFIEAISKFLVPQARGIISYPIFVLSIIYGVVNYSELSTILKNIFILNIGNFILYGVFSTRLFGGLGEGWRYISFASYFTTPIFFVLALEDDSLAIPKLCLLMIVTIILIGRNKTSSLQNRNEATYKVFDTCKESFDKDSILVGIPYYTTIPLLTSNRINKIVSHQLGDLCDSFVKEHMVTNNFFRIDLNFIKKYSITHIIFDENHLQYNERESVASILHHANLIYSFNGIHLYVIAKNLRE